MSSRSATRSRRVHVLVGGAIVLASIVSGVLWALVAPVEQLRVVDPGLEALLPSANGARFGAMAIFVLLTAGLGVASALGAWVVRSLRGPAGVITVVTASGLGAAAAAGAGLLLARALRPSADALTVGSIVTEAPGLTSAVVLVAQPFASAAMLLLLVVASRRDDLGHRGSEADPDREADPDQDGGRSAANSSVTRSADSTNL